MSVQELISHQHHAPLEPIRQVAKLLVTYAGMVIIQPI
jgi:hypothetical protein